MAELIYMLIWMEHEAPYLMKIVMCMLVETSSDMKEVKNGLCNTHHHHHTQRTRIEVIMTEGMDGGGERGVGWHVICRVDPFRATTMIQCILQGRGAKQQNMSECIKKNKKQAISQKTKIR